MQCYDPGRNGPELPDIMDPQENPGENYIQISATACGGILPRCCGRCADGREAASADDVDYLGRAVDDPVGYTFDGANRGAGDPVAFEGRRHIYERGSSGR